MFGSSINEERYRKGMSCVATLPVFGFTVYLAVIHQCCLEEDLGLFEDGDMTQVGERGLTLR